MQSVTRNEVLAIIDTYEGLLRRHWTIELLQQWTKWRAVLAGLEGANHA